MPLGKRRPYRLQFGLASPFGFVQDLNGGYPPERGIPLKGALPDICFVMERYKHIYTLNDEDNSYHVMLLVGVPENSDSLVVDGFVFTGGNANSLTGSPVFDSNEWGTSDYCGGGLLAAFLSETATIRNCTFQENYAYGGGGISLFESPPLLVNCLFQRNHTIAAEGLGTNAQILGGAMLNFYSTPRIESCLFLDNSAHSGGVMANSESSPIVLNSTFSGNNSPGVSLIVNQQSSPVFINSIFTGNYVTGTPDRLASTGFIVNSLNAAVRLVNCTVSGNYLGEESEADSLPFFMNILQSSTTVENSIIYGNEGINPVAIDTLESQLFVRYSLVQGMEADEANHNLAGDTDPLFVNTAAGDYRLQSCSPAINRGADALLPGGLTQDADGNPRTVHAVVDLGAFEFQAAFQVGGATLAIHDDESTNNINGETDFYGNGEACRLIARIEQTGDNPVSGSVTARIGIDPEVAFHNGSPYVQRYYIINAQEGESARLTLYFTQDEFDNFNDEMQDGYLPTSPGDITNKSNLRIYQFHGAAGSTPGDYQGSPLTVIAPNEDDIKWNEVRMRWEVSFAVEGFSGFFIGSEASPLPVRLVSFSGSPDTENVVLLNWEVVQQQDIKAYTVEYSSDGVAFEEAGVVAANQMPETRYAFRHTPLPGMGIAYYRLRISEADGTQSKSGIISLKLPERPFASVYPVPADRGIWVEGQGIAGTTVHLVNVHGVVLKKWAFSSDKQFVEITSLQPGMYFVRLQDGTSLKVVRK